MAALKKVIVRPLLKKASMDANELNNYCPIPQLAGVGEAGLCGGRNGSKQWGGGHQQNPNILT